MLRAAPLTRVIVGSFGGVENQSNSKVGSLREMLGAIEGPIVNRAHAARPSPAIRAGSRRAPAAEPLIFNLTLGKKFPFFPDLKSSLIPSSP